jgi:hypothetical protein
VARIFVDKGADVRAAELIEYGGGPGISTSQTDLTAHCFIRPLPTLTFHIRNPFSARLQPTAL